MSIWKEKEVEGIGNTASSRFRAEIVAVPEASLGQE